MIGSNKSKAEQEADDFDALLDDITKPETKPPAAQIKHEDPMPTGTFRANSENDGWDDLNYAEKTGGRDSSSRGYGNTGGNKYGLLSSKKKQPDEDDLVDDILDNLTAEKEIEQVDQRRPKTAAGGGNFENKRESLWSAGGPNNRNGFGNVGTGSKYGADEDDDDDLDVFGDGDDDDALSDNL